MSPAPDCKRLPTALHEPITSRAEGEAWIRGLVAADMMFHFEDDPATIVTFDTGTELRPSFHEDDHQPMRDRVRELYALDWQDFECPIGFALSVIPE